MSEQGAQMVLERWTEDESFRLQMRRDPKAAVRSIGADLDEEQLQYFESIDWSLPDEQLQPLLEKLRYC